MFLGNGCEKEAIIYFVYFVVFLYKISALFLI